MKIEESGYKGVVPRLLLPALLLVAACSPRPANPKNPALIELEALAAAEDARSMDPGFVQSILSGDPVLQRRAGVALGRLQHPDGAPFLCLLFGMAHDLEARRAALFAMGQLGLAGEALPVEDLGFMLAIVQSALDAKEETIRAAAVEALGKLDLDRAGVRAVPLLKDPSPLVRRQAASACFRWRQVLRWRDPSAKTPEVPKEVVDALTEAAGDKDAEVRWRAIHALLRNGAVPAAATIGLFLKDPEPLCRVFALGAVERHKVNELVDAVAKSQVDPDAQVRQAALRALDALDRPDLLSASLVSDPSHHVRQAVADLVASDGAPLEALSMDASPAVRSAALLARVRISAEKSAPALEKALSDPEPVIRMAAARGAGELKQAGLPLLRIAQRDSSELVRTAAYAALAEIEGPAAWDMIREGLAAPGLGERSGAVEALTKRKEPAVLDQARATFRDSRGRDCVEIREVLVDFLAGKPPEETTPFLLEVAKGDTAISVRQKAAGALRKRGVKEVPDPGIEKPTRTPHYGRPLGKQPIVSLVTTKGTVEITCFPEAAPVHVANFVGLAAEGFYDGLRWHRVVPNFVIQGGDPKGNGMGDAGWSVRAEINPVLFARGMVGMPRSAGFDTGGCQIFITHLPTPHLDGYYTVFGQVTRGMDVVDSIEVGDRIVEATVLP